MRLSRLRGDIEFTEDEFMALSRAANAAGLSLAEWMRRQLFSDSATETAEPTDAAVPVSRTEPPGVAAKETPSPRTAPELAWPIHTATASVPDQEPPTAVVPEPSASEPAPRKRIVYKGTPAAGPLGVDAILAAAARLLIGRDEVIRRIGTDYGFDYNMNLSRWHNSQPDFSQMASHVRSTFVRIARSLDAIKEWYASLQPWQKRQLENINAEMLERRWKHDQKEMAKNAAAQFVPGQPELRKSDAIPVWRNGQFHMESAPKPPNESAIEPEPATVPSGQVASFSDVNLDHLSSSDARRLRRFTDRLTMQGARITETMPEDKIAAVIRKIKAPNENGNTPPTAEALIRLGVLAGASGAYRLRPEFVARLSEIESWIKRSQLTA